MRLASFRHIEAALEIFATSEGLTAVRVMEVVRAVSNSHRGAAKNLDMLLAATGYTKARRSVA